jgi:maltooligosyltrehalose trehalohydrolase
VSAPSHRHSPPEVGTTYLGSGRTRFAVWAPRLSRLAVRITGPAPRDPIPLPRLPGGWFAATLDEVWPGTRYRYVLDDDRERPDPAARALPEGVHGPAEVVDPAAFAWTDAGWRGKPLKDMVLYEVHVGTFTPEGTFDAILPRLPALRDLGVTALELMPVASFPGSRDWGYDGVGLFAPQRSYGGPAGLQRLVDACHALGLAVVLDVVYNHLGPEGNYLAEFGPYFTDRYRTPWGQAVNFDGEGSRGVRDFVLANALVWIRDYHLDGLRLDAVHSIFDESPLHILRELNDALQRLARRLGRIVPVVAESDLNDRRVIDPVRRGGYGLAGQWSDDFHHALHVLLTGERGGYYADFGSLAQLGKAYTDGFVYDGIYSGYRGQVHGTPTRDLPAERFVVCTQNHDQVGNRAQGERLSALVDFERLKLAAVALLLSPAVPLLFMGEEYGEIVPFMFFADFGDPALRAAVTRGRREEFAAFGWTGEVPDPQDPATFSRSKLKWGRREQEPHRWLLDLYRTLLRLRREYPALGVGGRQRLDATLLDEDTLLLRRGGPRGGVALAALRFAPTGSVMRPTLPAGSWRRLVDTAEERFGGPGAKSPEAFLLRRGGRVELELDGYGAALYLRDPPRRLSTLRGRPAPNREVPEGDPTSPPGGPPLAA